MLTCLIWDVVENNVEPSGIEFTKFPCLWSETRAVKVGRYPKVAIGISGKEFATIREHMPDEHQKLILGATVFARMGPDQKAQLIEDLQDLVCASLAAFGGGL